MKILKSIIVILFFSQSLFAQHNSEGGIKFFQGSWNDAVKESAKTHKMIFVDAYASWCGPCKWMVANVFSNAAVASYYNQNFINFQIDMEKGEGPALSKKWDILAYPTFLFISDDSIINHKAVGSMDTTAFINTGKTALNSSGNLLAFSTRFNSGERTPELLKEYALALKVAYDHKSSEVADLYFNLLDKQQWQSKENLALLNKFLPEVSTPVYQFFYTNKNQLLSSLGEGAFMPFLADAALGTMDAGYHSNDELKIMDGIACLKNLAMQPQLNEGALLQINFYKKNKNFNEYKKLSVDYARIYFSNDANSLNNLAWGYFENLTEQVDLIQASKWASNSVQLEDAYYNNDTYANLLFASGQFALAKTVAEHAISLAEKNNEDSSSTEELLVKINEKLK